jgi:hypothetical protein
VSKVVSPEFTGPEGDDEVRAWLEWLEAFQTVSDSDD